MEADFALVDVEKTVIGDGDAMGVSRDVGQDLFGTGKGRLGVDPPICPSGGSKVAQEDAAVAERLQAPAEGQLFGVEGLLQIGKKQPTEKASARTGRKKLGRHVIQRRPSAERPPPATTQCKCG